MADWTNIVDSQLEPDAPLTSDLAFAWRDNPIAIAGGAAGAPRISATALANNGMLGCFAAAASTPITFTGLDTVARLDFSALATGSTSASSGLQISASSDGGGSWTSWVNMRAGVFNFRSIVGYFDLVSGVWGVAYQEYNSSSSNISADAATGTIAGFPFNAVQFQGFQGRVSLRVNVGAGRA